MKRIILFVLSIAIFCQAQAGINSAIPFRLNVLKDFTTYLGLPNLHGDSTHGDYQKLKDAIYLIGGGSTVEFDFPDSNGLYKYRFDTTVLAYSNTTFKGIGLPRFIATTVSNTDANMFETIGMSNVVFTGLTFINYHVKRLGSFVQFKSSPNQCSGNSAINNTIRDSWVHDAIKFGDAASNDSTHWNDNVLIEGNLITRLYEPGYEVITNEMGGDRTHHCNAVNFVTTTAGVVFRNNTITKCSGDGIIANGSNYGLRNNKNIGNWDIYGNYMFRLFMHIETLGPYYARGMNIHNNRLYYSNCTGGFIISAQGKDMKCQDNDIISGDRSILEWTGVGLIISGNTMKIICCGDTTQGVKADHLVARIEFIQLNGYNHLITGNILTEDRSNPNSTSPTEFNAFKFVGRSNGGNYLYQDTCYNGYCDYPGYVTITGNNVTGFTNKLLDATNDKWRFVTYENNINTTAVMVESPIQIYGYNWSIQRNKWFMKGSPAPTGSNALIKPRSSAQSDNNCSVVSDNPVPDNDAWKGTLYK